MSSKLREALEAINCIDTRRLKYLLCELVEADIPNGGQINKIISAVDKAKAALALPLRNCDVGTAEEQAQRFYSFCTHNRSLGDFCASTCPCLDSGDKCHCLTKWAQMPYEPVETKTKTNKGE